MTAFAQWLAGFLREGGNSSSRLIAVGSASIMAVYLLADIADRLVLGGWGMNENVMLACVAGLVTLGGGAYVANKVASVKRAQTPQDGGDAPG